LKVGAFHVLGVESRRVTALHIVGVEPAVPGALVTAVAAPIAIETGDLQAAGCRDGEGIGVAHFDTR
jgi:hypothetical protein